MAQIFGYSGADSIYAGSLYQNSNEENLFLSLGRRSGDVFFPPCKRSRISCPIVFSGQFIVEKPAVSIDVLPDECLFEVLRRLPGGEERSVCASVSKRWLMLLSSIGGDEICPSKVAKSAEKEGVASIDEAEVGNHGYLSRSIEGKKATDVRLAAIAVGTGHRGGLGKLTIRRSNSPRGITSLGLKSIARSCPSLKNLSLWNVSSVGDEGLYEIANGCHLLEKLEISHCPRISDKGLQVIAKNCPQLTSLTIENCPMIGDGGLQAFASYCPNLTSVSIKKCPLVGDNGIAALLTSAGGSLSKLKLHALNVSDISLAVIGLYGKALTDLSFTDLQNVGERGLWIMANGKGLQKLRSFTVTSCRGFTDVGLEAIGNGCPNLKQCHLQKCELLSDMGLVKFVKAAGSLECLHLEDCHKVTQFGLFGLLFNSGKTLKALTLVNCLLAKEVVYQIPSMGFSTSLRSIAIRNCPGFGNFSLAVLSKLCPQLQYLNFNGLHGITDIALLPLIQNSEAGLSKVSLAGCVNLTNKVVEVITKLHGLTLEQLDLEGCKFITDASLVAVAENCSLLSELNVSKCMVTDSGIAALASSAQLHLQVLSVSGCFISAKSLPLLLNLGRTLIGLNIKQCNGVSSKMVNVLEERLWRCDILS